MKQESFKARDFIFYLCKDRSTDKDYPYQMIISSKYVYPNISKEELLDLIDFINEFVENNQ